MDKRAVRAAAALVAVALITLAIPSGAFGTGLPLSVVIDGGEPVYYSDMESAAEAVETANASYSGDWTTAAAVIRLNGDITADSALPSVPCTVDGGGHTLTPQSSSLYIGSDIALRDVNVGGSVASGAFDITVYGDCSARHVMYSGDGAQMASCVTLAEGASLVLASGGELHAGSLVMNDASSISARTISLYASHADGVSLLTLSGESSLILTDDGGYYSSFDRITAVTQQTGGEWLTGTGVLTVSPGAGYTPGVGDGFIGVYCDDGLAQEALAGFTAHFDLSPLAYENSAIDGLARSLFAGYAIYKLGGDLCSWTIDGSQYSGTFQAAVYAINRATKGQAGIDNITLTLNGGISTDSAALPVNACTIQSREGTRFLINNESDYSVGADIRLRNVELFSIAPFKWENRETVPVTVTLSDVHVRGGVYGAYNVRLPIYMGNIKVTGAQVNIEGDVIVDEGVSDMTRLCMTDGAVLSTPFAETDTIELTGDSVLDCSMYAGVPPLVLGGEEPILGTGRLKLISSDAGFLMEDCDSIVVCAGQTEPSFDMLHCIRADLDGTMRPLACNSGTYEDAPCMVYSVGPSADAPAALVSVDWPESVDLLFGQTEADMPSLIEITTAVGTMLAPVSWELDGFLIGYIGAQDCTASGAVTMPIGVYDPSEIAIANGIAVAADPAPRGDMNGSGRIELVDAVLLARFIVGADELDSSEAAVGDFDDSGTVNVADLYVLLVTLSE